MSIRNLIMSAAGIVLLLHSLSALADEILIVGNEYKPPKVFLKDKEPSGILVDIMKYIDRHTEHSFDIQLYPWKRAYSAAEAGEAGIIGFSMTSERFELFDFSEVMYYDDMMLVVLKGHEFSYETIRDLKGKILGKSRGSSYGDEYEQGRKEIFKVDEDGDGLQRLKKLLYGRIDVALVGPGKAAVNQTINDDPELLARKDDFVILEKPFTRDPNYLGFAKSMKKQEFLKEFNRILQKGIADGTIQGIIDKYSNH